MRRPAGRRRLPLPKPGTLRCASRGSFRGVSCARRLRAEEDLRIVAGEGEPEEEVVLQPELDDDDEVVTEELAEIYLAQGLRDKSVAIYRKLSLRNPEKSVYFAELIGKIENNIKI